MSVQPEVERLRRQLDAQPGDDQAREELAAILARGGERDAAAEAYYLAACAARRRGEETLFRERINRCLECDPAYPVAFTGPPRPPGTAIGDGARVLVVHPESRVRGPIARLLADRGFRVAEAATAGSARAAIRESPVDLVITAPALVDGGAFEIATAARRAQAESAVVLLTCAVKGERIESPERLAALVDEHLDRPLAPDRLLEAAHAALWRHRHAAAVAPAAVIMTAAAAPPGLGSTRTRAALLVVAGYLIVFLLHLLLQSIRDHGGAADPAATDHVEHALPPALGWDEERALWVRLTSTQTAPGIEIAITVLTPELVAARAQRRAERDGAFPGAAADAARQAMDHLAPPGAISLELHLEVDRDLALDPAAIAASLKLRASDLPAISPSWLSPPSELRFVRESPPGQAPRVQALTLVASFPRVALGPASVYALSLAVGARDLVVFVPVPAPRS